MHIINNQDNIVFYKNAFYLPFSFVVVKNISIFSCVTHVIIIDSNLKQAKTYCLLFAEDVILSMLIFIRHYGWLEN